MNYFRVKVPTLYSVRAHHAILALSIDIVDVEHISETDCAYYVGAASAVGLRAILEIVIPRNGIAITQVWALHCEFCDVDYFGRPCDDGSAACCSECRKERTRVEALSCR